MIDVSNQLIKTVIVEIVFILAHVVALAEVLVFYLANDANY